MDPGRSSGGPYLLGFVEANPRAARGIVAFSDKLFHAIAFATLAAATAFALRVAHRTSPKQTALLAWAIAAAYGAIDEWHQLYVPGRYADIADIAADGVGALVAAMAAGWFLARRDARRAHPDSRRS